MEERWLPVSDFPAYEVSSLGRVRRGAREKVATLGKRGYYYVDLWANNKGQKKYLHTCLAEAFIPNPEGKPQVDHINRIKTDNRLENLRWATNMENNWNKEYEGKTNTGHLYIHRLPYGAFYLQIKRGTFRIQKAYPTLDDALLNRDEILSHL